MKKATIIFITSAAFAFALPLYATEKPGMDSESQQQADYSADKAGMKSDSQRQADYGADKSGMKSDSQDQADATRQQTDKMQSGQMITAEKLKGMEVVSKEGKEIGEIKNIKIDQHSGEVKFVTVSKGGILGIGADEIAVPLSAFDFSDDQAKLTVDQSKFENVPQQKAETTDSDYQRELETHYSMAPGREKRDRDDATQTQQKEQNVTEPGKVGTQN